jgi:hypothetical protein
MDLVSPELQRLETIEARLSQIEQRLKLQPGVSLESRFRGLVDQWKAERGHVSSVQAMAMHPAYQQIIGMGEAVLPLLLKEMQQSPSHWTWALRAITGENPVPPESRGKVNDMAEAWIDWGRQRGYVS